MPSPDLLPELLQVSCRHIAAQPARRSSAFAILSLTDVGHWQVLGKQGKVDYCAIVAGVSDFLDSSSYQHKEQLISVLGLVLRRVLQLPNHSPVISLLAVTVSGAWTRSIGECLDASELLKFGLATCHCGDPELQSTGKDSLSNVIQGVS